MIVSLIDLGNRLLTFFTGVFDIFTAPFVNVLRDLVYGYPLVELPSWLQSIIKGLIDVLRGSYFENYSLFEFMFGGALTLYLAIAVVNWVMAAFRG